MILHAQGLSDDVCTFFRFRLHLSIRIFIVQDIMKKQPTKPKLYAKQRGNISHVERHLHYFPNDKKACCGVLLKLLFLMDSTENFFLQFETIGSHFKRLSNDPNQNE